MLLKLEDDVYSTGASYQYINSEHICRILILRKRIRLYLSDSTWNYIYVGRTKHNEEELKKIGVEL